MGDSHYSNTAGDSYTFRFYGTQAEIFGKKSTNYGKMDVQIDGGAAITVDNYSGSTEYKKLLYTTGPLTFKQHTVTVTVRSDKNAASTGTVNQIDFIVVK
jgi:hypothetical protein